ncbi:MAG TPA: hypothetical protein VNU71_20225, partial [Burkholderiaceae bacterium]|nr:hypothetical protein [Burkholderiaceae bacterium]
MPVRAVRGAPPRTPWQVLRDLGEASPWREVVDEYTGDSARFHERHYNEFVTFLPYVQRFLYGEGRKGRHAPRGGPGGAADAGRDADAPMRVFRREDIAQVRCTARPGDAPVTLTIVHVDLYFFFDVDVVLLNLELGADDLSLEQAQEQLYRFGRGYPAGWDSAGHALHAMASVEWLDASGAVLARSDAQQRELFLAHVAEHRAPRTAAHWAFMLRPLVADHSDEPGELRYRQIEYYRMPLMGYLALDDPRALTRGDFVRLGLVTGAGGSDNGSLVDDATPRSMPEGGPLPYGVDHLADFEQRYCYDRFWANAGAAPNTRYLCSGHALIVIGDARSTFYGCRDRGVLAQFRHQHFMLFLIAHFQKAALLMMSDRLVEALKNLDVGDADSVRAFKRSIRSSFEGFLRFTHRYWFHEVSEQAQVRALSRLCCTHLGLDPLYDEVKVRMADMNTYLDADSLRRQANTVVRLTVVTILGLIGTVTTGFLGMNLLAEADAPMPRKLLIFVGTFVITTVLTFYTMGKSKGLSDFLDALS